MKKPSGHHMALELRYLININVSWGSSGSINFVKVKPQIEFEIGN